MATRLYFSGYNPSTSFQAELLPHPSWDEPTSVVTDPQRPLPMRSYRSGWTSSQISGGNQASTNAGSNVIGQFARWISAPLASGQTISGYIKGIFEAYQSVSNAGLSAQMFVRVVSRDGSIVRGTLYTDDPLSSGTAFATSYTNRKFPPAWSGSGAALRPLVVEAGDRILVEIGAYHAQVTQGTPYIRLAGGDLLGDLAENETDAGTNLCPWVEFSQDLTFEVDPGLDTVTGAASKTSGTTLVITTASGAALVDELIVVAFAMDNATGTVSATDASSNTYQVDADVTNSSGVRTVILSARVTTRLAATSTITITHPSVTARAAVYHVLHDMELDATARIVATSTATGTSSGPTDSITTTKPSVVIAALGVECEEACTIADATWLDENTRGTTGAGEASNIRITHAGKFATEPGTYDVTGATGSSRDWAVAMVAYRSNIPLHFALDAVIVGTTNGAATYVTDAFSRTNASAWGTADVGGAWDHASWSAGTGQVASTDGSTGKFTSGSESVASNGYARAGPVNRRFRDIKFRFKYSATPASTNSNLLQVWLNLTGHTEYTNYEAGSLYFECSFANGYGGDDTINLKHTNATKTSPETLATKAKWDPVANQWMWVWVRRANDRLYAKMWKDGQPEPDWDITATETYAHNLLDSDINTAAHIRLYAPPTTTQVVSFDDLFVGWYSGDFRLDSYVGWYFPLDAELDYRKFPVAAIKRETFPWDFDLEAWLIWRIEGSFALDAIRLQTITGAIGEAPTGFHWAARIAVPLGEVFELDAILLATIPGDFALDAIRRDTIGGDFALDAHVAWHFELDAWLAGRIDLDAEIVLAGAPQYGFFSVVSNITTTRATHTGTITLRAAIRTASVFSIGFELDALLGIRARGMFLIAAQVARRIDLCAEIIPAPGSFHLDAWLRTNERYLSFTADAVLRTTITPYVFLDAQISAYVRTGTITLDARIAGPIYDAFVLDAVLESGYRTGSFPLDADTRSISEQRGTIPLAAVLIGQQRGMFLVAAEFGTRRTGTIPLQAVQRVAGQAGSFPISAVLQLHYDSFLDHRDLVLDGDPVWYAPLDDAATKSASYSDLAPSYMNGSGWTPSTTPDPGNLLADTSDTTYAYVDQNASGTYTQDWDFGNLSTLVEMTSITISIRYRWSSYSTASDWPLLQAQYFKSDGSTPLSNLVTIASNITTTTATWSSAVPMTGIVPATKADWDAAVLRLTITRNKNGGGNTYQQRVLKVTAAVTYQQANKTVDDAVGTYNGTYGSGVTRFEDPPPLIEAGYSVDLNASGISLPDPIPPASRLPLLAAARTFVIWYRNSSTAALPLFYYGYNPWNTQRYLFQVYFNYDDQANVAGMLTLFTWGDDPHINVGSVLYDDQWHHLAITYAENATSAALWIDGTLRGTFTLNGVLATYGTSTSSYAGLGSDSYPGSIAHPAMYGRVLRDEEIVALAGGDRREGIRLDAILSTSSGAFPGHQGWFTLDAVRGATISPTGFKLDAEVRYRGFRLDAIIRGNPVTKTPPPFVLWSMIVAVHDGDDFPLDAWLAGRIVLDAFVQPYFFLDAYIRGNNFIIWPDGGGPAEDPDGIPLPAWYKANRKYRINITLDDVDVTGDVVWSQSTFTQNAKTNPGTFSLVLKGHHAYGGGEHLHVALDDFRTFGGIVLAVEWGYLFSATGPATTTLTGADYNILFDKTIVYNRASADDPYGSYTNYLPFARNSYDSRILAKVLASYVDDPELGRRAQIDTVAIANPEKPWAMPTPGSPLRQVFQSISQITSAVWWVDPYQTIHYHGRSNVTAPFPITDGEGGISSAEASASADISAAVTDTLLWGTLAKTVEGEMMVTHRSSSQLGAIGRWQRGEVRADLHHQSYLDRRADSIIERYGQPVRRAKVTIYEPGYQAGQVAQVKLNAHGIDEALVIRSMELTIAAAREPESGHYYAVPRFRLTIGLDPEEPWDIYDYLPFPDDKGTPWAPHMVRWPPTDCLDGVWDWDEHGCIDALDGGIILDAFDREIPQSFDYSSADPVAHSYSGGNANTSWGSMLGFTWAAQDFQVNNHFSVRDGRGVIHCWQAHYTYTDTEYIGPDRPKGQTTTFPSTNPETGEALDIESLLVAIRFRKHERVVNSQLNSYDAYPVPWNHPEYICDLSPTLSNTIPGDSTRPGTAYACPGGEPYFGTSATIDAFAASGLVYRELTFSPAESANIVGTFIHTMWDHASGTRVDCGAGVVVWGTRNFGNAGWFPNQTITRLYSSSYSDWARYVGGVNCPAIFYLATDERPDEEWPNRIWAKLTGVGDITFDRQDGGTGPMTISIRCHLVAQTPTMINFGTTTMEMPVSTIEDILIRWERPDPGWSRAKVWLRGTPEPEAWQLESYTWGYGPGSGKAWGVGGQPTMPRDFGIWGAKFNLQTYDLELDTVCAGEECMSCDDGFDPCADDPEGEAWGAVADGWNVERCVVYNGAFRTTAIPTRGTLVVYNDEGLFLARDWEDSEPGWGEAWDLAPPGQAFRVYNDDAPWVTACYRSYTHSLGSEYSAPRDVGDRPVVRTIPTPQ